MDPQGSYSMRSGNGGPGGGGHGGGAWTSPPTQQNPSPFVSEWLRSPGYQYARPGHQYLGGGGGGAQHTP